MLKHKLSPYPSYDPDRDMTALGPAEVLEVKKTTYFWPPGWISFVLTIEAPAWLEPALLI
jgi:hypothetical protein